MILSRVSLFIFVMLLILGISAIVGATPDLPNKVIKVTGDLALNKTITVEVECLQTYLAQEGKDAEKFILYLDWRPLKGVNARLINDPKKPKLQFDVRFTEDSKDAWNALLGSWFPTGGFTRPVDVSIGYGDDDPIPTEVTDSNKYKLTVVKRGLFWSFAIPLIIISLLVIVLGLFKKLKCNIIREPSTPLPGDPPSNSTDRRLSLGRLQMVVWFIVIVVCYIFIWMVTGTIESISVSALGLMGISAATGLGAEAVNAAHRNEARAGAGAKIINLKSHLSSVVLPNEKEAIKREIRALKNKVQPRTQGFWKDIFCDVNGLSFHRLQMFVWTVVLLIIFVITVYRNLAMPEFSATLLALMGISGGTYIGFKFPEERPVPKP